MILQGRAQVWACWKVQCVFFDEKPRDSILQIAFTMILLGKLHIKLILRQLSTANSYRTMLSLLVGKVLDAFRSLLVLGKSEAA